MDQVDRRKYGRISLDMPLPARLGELRVRVLELSVLGFLVAHETRLAPGDARPLRVRWQGQPIALQCEVVRSVLWRLAKTREEESVYHSGLRIVDVSREAFDALREMIAERILRALDEQKANARGIPPLAAYMYQPEKGELFRRCELVGSVWRKRETMHPEQPEGGFTISADVDPAHVALLCQTYQAGSAEVRRLTRMLAELSISRAEGIPTRRYTP